MKHILASFPFGSAEQKKNKFENHIIVVQGTCVNMTDDRVSQSDIAVLVKGIRQTENGVIQLECAQKLRKLLSTEISTNIRRVIEHGAVPWLIKFLEPRPEHGAELQLEAAWALTNLTYGREPISTNCLALTLVVGTSVETQQVVSLNVIPRLLHLVKTAKKDEELRVQCLWALGNIAGRFCDFMGHGVVGWMYEGCAATGEVVLWCEQNAKARWRTHCIGANRDVDHRQFVSWTACASFGSRHNSDACVGAMYLLVQRHQCIKRCALESEIHWRYIWQ